MLEFVNPNRQKIIYLTRVFGLVIVLLGFILSGVVAYTNDFESGIESFGLILLFGYLSWILILSFGLVSDYYFLFKKRLDFFNQSHLQEFFAQNQFAKVLMNKESKFKLSHYEMKGRIRDFEVVTGILPNEINKLYFVFTVDCIPLNQENFKTLSKLFKEWNAFFEFDGIFFEIKLDNHLTAETIKQSLYEFADMLIAENLKPKQVVS